MRAEMALRQLLSLAICLLFALGWRAPSEATESDPSESSTIGSEQARPPDGEEAELADLVSLPIEDLIAIKVNVSSSKGETVFLTPSTVTVIDRGIIEKYNFSSVSQALRTVAGFSILRTYAKRGLPTSRGILQDHYANKVLVMINNIPTWHAVTGEPNLQRININDVERIEVLKGPASVLYGTNAYSGAVNIVLRRTENPTESDTLASTHLEIGTGSSFGGGGNVSFFAKDDLSISVYGNASYERGHDLLFVDEQNMLGHMTEYIWGSNFTLDARYKGHSLFFNAYDSHESFLGVIPRFGAEPTSTGGAGHDHEGSGYLAHYGFSMDLSDRAAIKSGITYDRNRRDLSRTRDDNMRANIEGHRLFGFLRSAVTVSDQFSVELGADYDYRESLEYKNYNVLQDTLWNGDPAHHNNMENRSVQEYSVLGQLQYSWKSLSLLAGTRYTYNENFGDNVSSRGSLVLNINDKNSIKLIFGQSYRAPSLFELYFRTPQKTVFGSEDLEPEKSTSYEVAYLISFDRFFFQVLGYYATYENKIHRMTQDIVVDGELLTDKSVYANGDDFEAIGTELEIRYENPRLLSAFLSYGFIHGNDADNVSGHDCHNFKYVPTHSITFGVVKEIDDFFLSCLIDYQSEAEGPKSGIADQYAVDLNLGYRHGLFSFDVLHTLSATNLTDQELLVPEYVRRRELNATPLGYGREIIYTLRLTF